MKIINNRVFILVSVLVYGFLVASTKANAGWLLDHWQNHHHVQEHECALKAVSIPENAVEALQVGESVTVPQYDPDINKSGYVWINWQSKNNIFNLTADFAHPNGYESYVNPYNRNDTTPNVGDWIWDAYINKVDYPTALTKFKHYSKKKTITVALWKEWDADNEPHLTGWEKFKNDAACAFKLASCKQKRRYKISGYASFDVIGGSLAFEQHKPLYSMQLKYNGRKRCFNRAPEAKDQNITTPEDTPIAFNVSATDLDNDKLGYKVATQSAHGTVSKTDSGYVYTPNPNYFGNDAVHFEVSDGIDSTRFTVNVQVTPVNDAPVAKPQQLETLEDTAKNITLFGSDIDSQNLSYTIITQPQHGSVSLQGNKVVYTPEENYFGSDSLVYQVNDGELSSDATVKIVVKPVNDAPVAQSQQLQTREDTALKLLLKANDIDSQSLTYKITQMPVNGELTGQGNELTYTPKLNFSGNDKLIFTVSDGEHTSQGVIDISVTPVNDAPVAQNQSVETLEDTLKRITLFGSDIDSENLTYLIKNQPLNGKVTIQNNLVMYTPKKDFVGRDTFVYSVSDGGLTSDATIEVRVTPVNDAPSAQNQNLKTQEDTPLNIILKATDVDSSNLVFKIKNEPEHGTFDVSGKNVTYSPKPEYNGKDSIIYTVSDGEYTSEGIVSINVLPVNDAPTAEQQNVETIEDKPIAIKLLANDIDSDKLTYQIKAQPKNGKVSLTNNVANYKPTNNFNGKDTFEFIVNDGELTATAVISINVLPANDAPVAKPITAELFLNQTKAIKLLGSDPDSQTLIYTIKTQPNNGKVILTQDVARYTPNLNYAGKDTFSYVVSDGELTAEAQVSVNVLSDNPNPVLQVKDLTRVIFKNTAVDIDLLKENKLTTAVVASIIKQPAHGIATLSNGVVTYTPNTNYLGGDEITYLITNKNGSSNVAKIKLDVVEPSNQGRDFWLTFLPNSQPANNLTLFISAQKDTDVTIEVPLLNFKKKLAVSAGTISNVDLVEFYNEIPKDAQSKSKFGVLVTSDQYVSVYALHQQQFTTDAASIIPLQSLGKNYMHAGFNQAGNSKKEGMAIVATEDGTQLNIKRREVQVGQSAPEIAENISVTLNKGEVYSLNYLHLGGTTVNASEPVAVFSGNECSAVANLNACDHLYEQIAPVDVWSTEVITAPLATRKRGDTFRIYAAYNNTKVFVNQKLITTLQAGGIYQTILAGGNKIESNKPIWVNQFANSSGYDGITADPFMMGLSSTANYLKQYTVLTLDKGFKQHFLNIVALKKDANSVSVNGKLVASDSVWADIAGTDYQFTQIKVDAGVYSVRADSPFGLYVYGFGVFDSYGYTGGFSFSNADLKPKLFLSVDEDTSLTVSDIPAEAIVTQKPLRGKLSLSNGQYVYVPNENFYGLDRIGYTYSKNGQTVSEFINIDVLPVDDAPANQNVPVSTPEEVSVEFEFKQYDIDADKLSFKLLDKGKAKRIFGTGKPNGFKYVPEANFFGNDKVVFEVTDGKSKALATALISVSPVNDAPTVKPFTVETKGEVISFSLAADENNEPRGNDIEDGNKLTYAIADVEKGTATLNGDTVTYTPEAGFDGITKMYYFAKDSEGLTGKKQKITVNVNSINDTPITKNISKLINEDMQVAFTLEATDEENDDITYSIIEQPAYGVLQGSGNQYVYIPNPNFNGVDKLVFGASDGNTVGRGTVSIIVNPVNDAPTTKDQTFTIEEDTPVSITLDGEDADGEQLGYEITKMPDHGTLSGTLPQFVYTPAQDFVGEDTITYKVSDGKETATGTIKITLTPVDDAPRVKNQLLTTSEDNALSFTLDAVDPEGKEVLFRISQQPKNGTVTLNAGTNTGTYTPKANFYGSDSFSYIASDGNLESPGKVVINVTKVSDAPVAENTVENVSENRASIIRLKASDVDGDTLTYTITQQPAHGTLTENGALPTYTPNTDYAGEDLIKFSVSDGANTANGEVKLIVKKLPNRLPVWQSQSVTQVEATKQYIYKLKAYDPDTGAITYSLNNTPAGMTLTGDTLSWTPSAAQIGKVTFTVVATDSEGGETPQTINLTVLETSVAPDITSQPRTTSYAGKPYVYQVIATDANAADTLTYSVDNAPAGMTMDASTGKLSWPVAAEGVYQGIVVKVSDGRWIRSQTYTLNILKEVPLKATIVAPDTVNLNESFDVTIAVAGAGSDAVVELTNEGVAVPVDANYKAKIMPTKLGRYELKVTVTEGNAVSTDTHYYIVRDKADTTEPTVSLTQTDDTLFITKPTDITGSISDNKEGVIWSVNVYDSFDPDSNNNPAPIVSNTGTGNVTGTLATIDPTLLVNGAYSLVIKVTDVGGNTTYVNKTIIIDGKMKLGELAFTLEDQVVPMPNLDVSIQRSYDSRLGYKSGDFGHGWNLGIQQIKMRQSRPVHTGWQPYLKRVLPGSTGFTQVGLMCVRPYGDFKTPTVTVTLPDGNVETFEVEFDCKQGIMTRGKPIEGTTFSYKFKAKGDTQSTFDIDGQHTIYMKDGRWLTSNRPDVDANGNVITDQWFVPERFWIQTKEGVRYEFHRTKGVQKVTYPNGETLTIDNSGITHSKGTGIGFVRDGANRITQVTLPDSSAWKYGYDAAGDLVQATAPNGTVNKYVYDANHRLLKITDKDGVRLAGYEYDTNGRLVAMVDANGQKIKLEHQLDANQQKVTDQNGNATIYTYDDYGNVTREEDALGNVTLRSFDTKYNKLSETDANGNTTEWSYDSKNNKLTEKNALGQVTNYTYDSRSRMLTETDHTGRVVSTNAYDGYGQLTSLKDAAGNVTGMTYDGSGLTGIKDALGNETKYVYNGDDIKEMTDALGKKHAYTYDDNNRKTQEVVTYKNAVGTEVSYTNTWVYDAKGRVTSEIINGVTTTKTYGEADEVLTSKTGDDITTYVYDANKKLIQTTYPDGSVMKQARDANGNVVKETDALGRETVHEYDALNRKTKTTYPDGSSTSMTYDGVGNVLTETDARGNVTTHTYDKLNRKLTTTDALNNDHSYTYDDVGRLVEEKDKLGQVTKYEYNNIDQRIKTIYADGTTMQVEYDALGRKKAEINELGQRTEYTYNALGNLTQVKDALGQVTAYGYDAHANKVSQTDALGRITKWQYDNDGRQTGRVLPSNDANAVTYDAKGRAASMQDFNAQQRTVTYDKQDRVVQTTYADNSSDVTTFDAVGNRVKTQTTDKNGNAKVTRYTYDSLNRLSAETKPNGDVLSYGYDVAGNKTRVTLTASNGFTQETTHSYDALNRLASTTESSGKTNYTYNAVGNKASETKPNGVTTTYSYNSKNQLTQMEHSKDNTVLARYSYTLDLQGKRTQLVEEVFGASPKTTTSTWAYDDLGRLVSETVDGSTTTHEYDAVSNRVKQTKDGQVTTYTYDVNDRLTAETGARTASYTYDKQGNTLTQAVNGVTTNYGYNAKQKLIQANDVSFNYDIDGVRSSKTKGNTTISYTTDKNRDYAQVVLEKQNNQTVASYTYGDDLISQNVAGGTSYFGYDGLGSTKFLTNDSGAITDTYQYDAYGEITSKTGTTDNNYLYTGEQYDRSLNQYYLRARYYNQGVGRFTQMDTWQGAPMRPTSLNKYLYAEANPVMFTDPSGHFISLGGLMSALRARATLATRSYVKYSSKKRYTVYKGKKRLLPTIMGLAPHKFMYVERKNRVSGLKYDVGLQAGTSFLTTVRNPNKSFAGGIQRRRISRARLLSTNSIKKVTRFTKKQFKLWNAVVFVSNRGELSNNVCRTSVENDYSIRGNGINCFSWTKEATKQAEKISKIPF